MCILCVAASRQTCNAMSGAPTRTYLDLCDAARAYAAPAPPPRARETVEASTHEWVDFARQRNRIRFGACYVNESQTRNQLQWKCSRSQTHTITSAQISVDSHQHTGHGHDVDGATRIVGQRARVKRPAKRMRVQACENGSSKRQGAKN